MKKIIFTFFVLCFFFNGLSQSDSSLIYLRFPTIPAFSITKTPDSTVFTKKDLKKKKATVFFFFNPDCDHCHQETKNLIAKIELLKDVQIIMISIMEYQQIKKFYLDYKIADFPNITMARESTTLLPTFYKIHSIPDVYVYDKKGNFIKNFKGSVPVEEIAKLL
jgi:thioredoxin-related protein